MTKAVGSTPARPAAALTCDQVSGSRRHEGLEIVIDHCAKPDIAGGRFESWAAHIAALARLPHVDCKLSGLLNCAAPGAGAPLAAIHPDGQRERAEAGAGVGRSHADSMSRRPEAV